MHRGSKLFQQLNDFPHSDGCGHDKAAGALIEEGEK